MVTLHLRSKLNLMIATLLIGTSAASVAVAHPHGPPAPAGPTLIKTCGEIVAPGSYLLANNLTAPSPDPCIKIAVKYVTLVAFNLDNGITLHTGTAKNNRIWANGTGVKCNGSLLLQNVFTFGNDMDVLDVGDCTEIDNAF